MIIGPNLTINPAVMNLDGSSIEWVKQFKYLGITLVAASKFTVDLSQMQRNFFIAINCIFYHCKFTSESVKLELVERHCLPILLYCAEVLDFNVAQLREINSWWNSVYRKIYGFNKWESVKELIFFLNRVEIVHMVNFRYIHFLKTVPLSNNSCMLQLYNHIIESPELVKACSIYKIKFHWSISFIKHHINEAFREVCLQRLS